MKVKLQNPRSGETGEVRGVFGVKLVNEAYTRCKNSRSVNSVAKFVAAMFVRFIGLG